MTDIWTRLKSERKPILLYGTGNGADKILDELERLGIEVQGVFASDGFVRNRSFRSMKVLSLEEAEKQYGGFLALFSFGSNRPEVLENVKKIMTRHEVLAPEVPVCGGEIFNIAFARRHRKELETVYSLLADELSQKTFRETLLFKLDGGIEHLFCCEADENEAFADILKLGQQESFLDLGAYNGDTALGFAERVGSYSHITALEPDPKSFRKLVNNTKLLKINCINAAVSDRCGKIPFAFHGSRSSLSGGSALTDAVTIDELAKDRDFSYIKMDVEGQELCALCGGAKTIARDKPKMLVSCYHRSEDYFTLPLAVLKINPGYQIFMRHYPYIPAWDTNFYFI